MEPTPTPTDTPTETPTVEPTETVTEEPSETPTATPTEESNVPPVGTATATPTPRAVVTLVPSGVRLNEVLANPRSINWDERGRANAQDEWIELYNPTSRPVDISRWTIEAPGRRLSQVFRFSRNTVVPARGYLLLFQRESRLVLDNQGGTLRLLDANGRLLDLLRYDAMDPDMSYSRDAEGTWHPDTSPSPGEANVLPKLRGSLTPTPTPRPSVQG